MGMKCEGSTGLRPPHTRDDAAASVGTVAEPGVQSIESAAQAAATKAAHSRHGRRTGSAATSRVTGFAAALLLLVCALAAPGVQAESDLMLADGRRVTVIDLVEVEPEAGERTLILEYRTELDLGDRAALAAEIDAVWQSLRATVEAAGVSSAAIKAMAPPTGFLRKRSRALQTTVFRRGADGEWLRR